jgi:hypothetical protein
MRSAGGLHEDGTPVILVGLTDEDWLRLKEGKRVHLHSGPATFIVTHDERLDALVAATEDGGFWP